MKILNVIINKYHKNLSFEDNQFCDIFDYILASKRAVHFDQIKINLLYANTFLIQLCSLSKHSILNVTTVAASAPSNIANEEHWLSSNNIQY